MISLGLDTENHDDRRARLIQYFICLPVFLALRNLACVQKSFRVEFADMSHTHPLTTTAFELPGYRVTKNFGVVRGIIVRSRSVIGNFAANIQTIFGGNISIYTSLCEQARDDAFRDMLAHGSQLGANAIIGVRYDATEIAVGVTEVLCYGTAVFVEPAA